MELDPAFPLRFLFLFQEFCTCKEEFVMPQPSGKGDAACSQRPPLSMVRAAMFQGVTICQAGSRHFTCHSCPLREVLILAFLQIQTREAHKGLVMPKASS